MTQAVDKFSVYSSGVGVAGVDAYKSALAKFPTGVTVVTACNSKGQPIGLTVNSFASISLEPAVVSWSLRLQSSLYGAFTEASGFVVNVLACNQDALAKQFAARVDDRFQGVEWGFGVNGDPVLAGAVAVFECETVSSLIIGDHQVFFGGVIGFAGSDLEPLIMHSGKVVDGNGVKRLNRKAECKLAGDHGGAPVRFMGSDAGSNFTF